MRFRSLTSEAATLAILTGFLCSASPQTPSRAPDPLSERVLVVYNSAESGSLDVAKYYMAQRTIPENNRCKISVGSPEIVKNDEFQARVKTPVRKCLQTVGKGKILYIVLSYGTPYVLILGERRFSLDQFVADIWDEYSPATRPGYETGPQPYYREAQTRQGVYPPHVSLAEYRGRPGALNLYSVWRLDAATPKLAKGLVSKARFAEEHGLRGIGCFDRQYGPIENVPDSGSHSGDWDIHAAAEWARRAGFTIVEDPDPAEFGAAPAPLRCDGAALYAGWYSLNHYNDAFTWAPGAIGIHLDSASAADPRGGTNWSANAVLKGITMTSGAVAEPYLDGLPHPDQVFLALLRGANAGDAFFESTRWLKWMVLNIGDPLYRPFPAGVPQLGISPSR